MSSRTPRGFAYYTKFTDGNGTIVRVQQSSSAGKRRVWIFADLDGNGEQPPHHLGKCASCAPHLSPSQARRVAKALLRFADA